MVERTSPLIRGILLFTSLYTLISFLPVKAIHTPQDPILSTPPLTQGPTGCPPGWHASAQSTSCVKVYSDLKTWVRARRACQAEGADLVEIPDQAMNDFVSDILPKGSPSEFWVGSREHHGTKTRTFVWLDGSVVEYLPWGVGQPTYNYVGGMQECLVTSKEGTWSDHICESHNAFVCQSHLTASTVTPRSIEETTAVTQAVSANPASTVCPPDWLTSPDRQSCVKLYDAEDPWPVARQQCQNVGADLLIIPDKTMNDFVTGLIKWSVWIGLHDMVQEKTFMWLDERTEAQYHPWGAGEPAFISVRGEEDCTVATPAGTWRDRPCMHYLRFICQMPIQAPTTSGPIEENSTTHPLSTTNVEETDISTSTTQPPRSTEDVTHVGPLEEYSTTHPLFITEVEETNQGRDPSHESSGDSSGQNMEDTLHRSSGLSDGAVIGIVVAALAFAVIIVGGALVGLRYWRPHSFTLRPNLDIPVTFSGIKNSLFARKQDQEHLHSTEAQ